MDEDTPTPDEAEREIAIGGALQSLPLFAEPYLRMQATNLDVLDQFLMQQESQLLHEYFELERTPFPSTLFVSALSQLWLFGLYELLRTWRQRGKDVLKWSKEWRSTPVHQQREKFEAKKLQIENRAADPKAAELFYWPPYEKVTEDPFFAEAIRKALDGSEWIFQRIAAFRVALAKHELPRMEGSYALSPGYGRIDMTDGSIYWQIVLEKNEVDLVSRRKIADLCRELAIDKTSAIVPENLQERMKSFPNIHYGVKKIGVTLDDGTNHRGVYVGWCKEILNVEGFDSIPFNAERIVNLFPDGSEV